MSDANDRAGERRELKAPKALRGDLKTLFGAGAPVPREVDEAILAMANERLGRRRRPRHVLRWAGALAAAAALVLAVSLTMQVGEQRPVAVAVTAAEDIDRNGRVDILDAFALARNLEARKRVQPEWDVTGDGRVDRADVDAVAAMAVRLDQGAS